MARIDKRGDKWRVRITIKGNDLTHSFHDYETAVLWGKYKESLLNEIAAFDVPPAELVLFSDAIDLKVRQAIRENLDDRTIKDLQELHRVFECFSERPIQHVTYDDMKEFSERFLQTPTFKGGNRMKGTGRPIMPTLQTLLSKFRRLSGVYSNLTKNGIPVDNIALQIGAWINEKIKAK